MFKQLLLGLIVATPAFLCSSNAEEILKIEAPQDTLLYLALRKAIIQTFGTPPKVATKLAAQITGGLVGTIAGVIVATAIHQVTCTNPSIMWTEAVPRSEQIISYCLLTFCEAVGCVSGAALGGKIEELIRNCAAEFARIKKAKSIEIASA